jgi:hypothetical protein
MTDDEKRSRALAAGHAAIEAATELIRYAREGENWPAPFGNDVEPVEKLLDAAKMAIEVETGEDFSGERGQVYSAIANHLEGWAG